MEKAQEFIEAIPQEKSVKEFEQDELSADYHSYFSTIQQEIYEKRQAGGALSQSERNQLNFATEKWWHEKYAFPYCMKKERQELLSRKYTNPEAKGRAHELQRAILTALRDNDNERYMVLYKEYLAEFPDQTEGVTALLEFSSHLETHQYLNEHSFQDKDPEVRKEMLASVERATQYNFLLTDFIAHNGADKEFLKNFWGVLDQIAENKDMLKTSHNLRRGILSQVATLKIFERLGASPRLSHPKEDAFKSVDFWIEGTGAVQVKGAKGDEMFIETDTVNFPGVQMEGETGLAHYNSHLTREMERFSAKLEKYQEELDKPLKGYFVVVPYHEFDFITGEPSDEIIERAGKNLHRERKPALDS